MNEKEGLTMFQLTQTDKQALYNDDAEYFTDKGARAYSREEYREAVEYCTAPQKLDMKNLTFGVFFYEINL